MEFIIIKKLKFKIRKMNKIKIYLILLTSVIGESASGQWNIGPGGQYGRTSPPIQKIGIGNFFINGNVQSKFHISNFLLAPDVTTDGFLFRTDGNQNVNNQWQLFTGLSAAGLTEKFRLFVPAGTPNALLNVFQNNGNMQLQTNSITRLYIESNTGPTAGFIGIGANYLTPINLLDVNGGNINVQTITNSYKLNNRDILWHKGDITSLFVGVEAGQNHAPLVPSQNTFLGYQAGFSSPGNIPLSPSLGNVLVGYQSGFNTISSGNTYVGWGAGFSHNNPTNGFIVCVGYECGFLNQDADNAFYGSFAARNHVNGSGNSVFGHVAGQFMNNCNDVTVMGLAAGGNNSGFSRNNYFGARAGLNTVGEDNVFIGTNAGINGVGSKNVLMGNQAMQAATSGSSNVVIGYNSNGTSSGSSFNTIIGAEAALANASGASNTYVGYQSALAQTTGTGNVYMGLESGSNMLGGSQNTFLGVRTGANVANSTFTNAAAIGAGAQVTADDHMILGNNAVNVGIGLSGASPGPQNKLEINTSLANTSGLRFRQLTSASPVIANPGSGVLSVDANGDVVYVPVAGGGALGNICGTNTNPLTSSWEIPLNGQNFLFGGNGAGTAVNNVGVGVTCTPLAKLHVQQSSGSLVGSTGILVENTDQNNCNTEPVIGLKSIVSSPNLNDVKCAGWFESTNAPNCFGSLLNYAIIVPQNGGMVQIGYAPTSPTNFGTYLLDVNGTTFSAGGYQPSDVTLKNTVVTLPNSLNKIKNLRPVTYKWNTVLDSGMAGTHAGFIAQEVDTVIPQLVKTNTLGQKSISYNEMIPYLVSAMQELIKQNKQQDSIIQVLTQNISACCSNSAARETGIQGNNPKVLQQYNINLSDEDFIVLNQNEPNPFAEQTTITYNVPEKYGFAQLVFKTIDGKIIKTVDITKKGRGQVNVFASDLSKGM